VGGKHIIIVVYIIIIIIKDSPFIVVNFIITVFMNKWC